MTFQVRASQLANFMELYRLACRKKDKEPTLAGGWGRPDNEYPTGYVVVTINNHDLLLEHKQMLLELYC